MYGMPCRFVVESVAQNPPREGLSATAADLRTIAITVAAFNELISNIKATERTNAANKLNTYGQPVKEYQIGDRVAFYLPPSDKEAKRMGKNPKHMLQYQGTGIITEAISDNGTVFSIKCNNRTYNRNIIMHISPYTATDLVAAELQLHVDTTINEGSYVVVLDNTGDTKYHIAKVIEVGEQTTRLPCTTTSRRLGGSGTRYGDQCTRIRTLTSPSWSNRTRSSEIIYSTSAISILSRGTTASFSCQTSA